MISGIKLLNSASPITNGEKGVLLTWSKIALKTVSEISGNSAHRTKRLTVSFALLGWRSKSTLSLACRFRVVLIKKSLVKKNIFSRSDIAWDNMTRSRAGIKFFMGMVFASRVIFWTILKMSIGRVGWAITFFTWDTKNYNNGQDIYLSDFLSEKFHGFARG